MEGPLAVLVKTDSLDPAMLASLCQHDSRIRIFRPISTVWIEKPDVSAIEQSPHAIRCELDTPVYAPESTPNLIMQYAKPVDPFVQSGLSYAHERIHTASAWYSKVFGAGVTVSVLDTGIVSQHEDIDSSLVIDGVSYVDNEPTIEDGNGHGTLVSGVIFSIFQNGRGGSGVAPKCRINPLKVLGNRNVGTWSDVIEALLDTHAAGAKIANLSLGATVGPDALKDAVDYVSKDTLLVCAAGNAATELPFYPASFDGCVSVGATDERDRRWSLSNYGPTVDIYAPGSLIVSPYHLNNEYRQSSGTSMAAPHVSGAAALLLSKMPSLSVGDVKALLVDSAKRTAEGLRLLNIREMLNMAGIIDSQKIYLPVLI